MNGHRIFPKGAAVVGQVAESHKGAEDGTGKLGTSLTSVQQRDQALKVEATPYKVEGLSLGIMRAGLVVKFKVAEETKVYVRAGGGAAGTTDWEGVK